MLALLAHVRLILIHKHCFAGAFIQMQLEEKVLQRNFTHFNESKAVGTAWFMVGLS